MSSDVPGNRGDQSAQVVDVSYTLKRAEARVILRGFWARRLLRISPGLAVFLFLFVRTVGPPYAVAVIAGLLVCSVTLGAVMVIWDHGRLKTLCRHVRVRWSPTRVQVTNPDGTNPFQWSEVTGCKLSNRFLSTSFATGSTIHVPKRAFASEADLERVLGLAKAATAIDVHRRTDSEALVTDVRNPTDS